MTSSAAADSLNVLITPTLQAGPNIRITGWPAGLIILGALAGLVLLVWRFFHHRQKAAALHLRAQMQYRALFENGPCGMFMYDTRTQKILAGNPVLAGMLRCSTEDIAQLSLKDLFSEEVTEDARRTYGSGELMPPQAEELITRMRRCDGTEMDVDARGRPMDPKAGHARVVMIIDVTERLAAERALRAAEHEARLSSELLRSIIDVAPQAVVALDLDYHVTLWNHAAEAMFGWSSGEVIGKPLAVVPAGEQRTSNEHFREIVREGKSKSYELSRMRKDGSQISVIGSGGMRRGADGQVVGYVVVYTDLTQYRLLEAQLRQSQKMEAVGRLAGGVAHDFNNMLTVISSYAQLLIADKPAGDMLEPLEEIDKASSRAAALTRQLLTFGRKQVVVSESPVNLNDVIGPLEPMLRRVSAANVEVRLSLAPDLGVVLLDAAQFEQVIVNLAVNSADAMPEGGSILVETSNVTLDADYASTHQDVTPGRYVMLAVTDTGSGMDSDTLGKIFEPFFTTKQPGRGTGLGLAIAYSVVRQANGHIWVYSEPGSGTTFKIYLPRVNAAAERRTPVAPMRAIPGGGTVLLVEDDSAVRRGVQVTLSRLGYTVLEADGGEAALALLAANPQPINAVLTDLMMPGMSGRELSGRIRAERPDLRVLFMSGYTDDDVVRRQLVDEGHLFLQKPFTSDQLITAIES